MYVYQRPDGFRLCKSILVQQEHIVGLLVQGPFHSYIIRLSKSQIVRTRRQRYFRIMLPDKSDGAIRRTVVNDVNTAGINTVLHTFQTAIDPSEAIVGYDDSNYSFQA